MQKPQAKYEVRFWTNDQGEKPVAKWLKELSAPHKKYFVNLLNDLMFDGPYSRPKIFKHLDDDLWEVRDLRTRPGYRIYFGFDGHRICIVLHAGNKTTQKRDIELSQFRLSTME